MAGPRSNRGGLIKGDRNTVCSLGHEGRSTRRVNAGKILDEVSWPAWTWWARKFKNNEFYVRRC